MARESGERGRPPNPTTKDAQYHGLIKKKQREISAPYSEAKPSEVTEVFWIYAERKAGKYPSSTSRSGKWLVFAEANDVDEVWAKIKRATEEGRLGDSAKVATSKPSPLAVNPSKRVICVYSYDWMDENDVRRIREELRRLSITNKISYKSDEDTLSGKYRATGYTRISKYYE